MRELIISEIKRLALANDGVAPGKSSFEKETAIKSREWGRYWPRWSEAVAEAGLNAQLWTPKKDLHLHFPLLAELVKIRQRFPTEREFDIFRNANREMPTFSTFRAQFGNIESLREAFRNWASESPLFQDVTNLIPITQMKTASVQSKSKEGWVYLLKSGEHYKIGCGEELEKRVKQIKTNLPDTSALIHAIRTDDPFGIESYWHRRFDEKRANGEWFKLNPADIAAFRKRKYQ